MDLPENYTDLEAKAKIGAQAIQSVYSKIKYHKKKRK